MTTMHPAAVSALLAASIPWLRYEAEARGFGGRA